MKSKQRVILVLIGVMCLAGGLYWGLVPRGAQERPERVEESATGPAIAQAASVGPGGPGPVENLPEAAAGRGSARHTLLTGEGADVAWNGRTPAAHSAQRARLNRALLTEEPVLQAGDQLEVHLGPGQSWYGQVSKVRKWGSGTVAVSVLERPAGEGRLFLSYTRGEASILLLGGPGGRDYQVAWDSQQGAYVILEIDYGASDILEGSPEIPVASGVLMPGEAAAADSTTEDPQPAPTPQGDSPATEVTIDILAVYTPAARDSEGSTAGVENAISQSVLLANEVHSNSDTRILFNLVHSAEVVYTEDNPETTSSPNNYLDDLTDGNISGVHALRETHQADFVVFYVNTQMTGGLAWRPANYRSPDSAFSLVRVQQASWTYTMVHEVGHNMGLGHSATQAVQAYDGSFYPDAAGWQWADASSSASIGYCSVMTYENFDGVSGNEYKRVPYFSNPDISYNGNPTGDPAAGNAARVLRNGRFEYAGYRGAKPAFTASIGSFPHTEGFEDYTGFWYQPDADSHEWDTLAGPTYSEPTGPSSASSGDYYAYIEASNYTDKTADLQANVDLTSVENTSIAFSWHMFGSTMGSLALEVSTNGGSTWVNLWSQSGNAGDTWFVQSVSLAAYDGQAILLRFRGQTGSNYLSDIALDSVTLDADPALDPGSLSVDRTVFEEVLADDGSTTDTVTFTLSGDTYAADVVSAARVSATGVPAGLSAQFTRLDDTRVRLALSGNALASGSGDDVGNLTVTFTSGAFGHSEAGSVAGNPQVLSIDFADYYPTWTTDAYPGLSDPAEEADPDGDGMTNFLEYALGMDPTSGSLESGPEMQSDPVAGTLTLSFSRTHSHIRYRVQSSTDPGDWSAAVDQWDSQLNPPDLVSPGQVQDVVVPLPPGGLLFLRVHAME